MSNLDDPKWNSRYAYSEPRKKFEKLILRVKDFVKCRKELEDKDLKEREDIVSKLISGKLERAPIPALQVPEDCGIHRLSDADIRNVLDQVGDLRSLYACELVCKRWNTIVRDIWLSKRKLVWNSRIGRFYSNSASIEAKKKLFALLKKCPELCEFDSNLFLDEATFFIIGNCCPKIEKLVFRNAKMDKGSLKSLAKYCPQLKALHLPFCNYLTEEDLESFIRIASGLESLNLQSTQTGNIHITGECFHHLSEIKELNVKGCRKVTEASIAKLAEKFSHSLVGLGIGPISRRSFSIICESFPNLEVLSICRIEESTDREDNGLITPCRLEKLESLRIDGPYKSSMLDGRWKRSDIGEKIVKMIKSAKKLKKLILTECTWLNDDVISLVPTFCEKIEWLYVSSSQVTDEGLISLLKLKTLVKLWLSYTKVTDEGIMKVLTGCPNLALLDVNGCSSVTIATLLNAYDLTRQGLLNKQLVIRYKKNNVGISTILDRDDITDYNYNYDYDYDDYTVSSRDADFYYGSD